MQLELTDYEPIFSDLSPSVVEQFLEYHKTHPFVFELFKKYAHEARRRWNHFSGRDVMGRIRWDENFPDQEEFKANNSHVSCYVRMLIFEDKSFEGFFSTRHTPGTVFGEAA